MENIIYFGIMFLISIICFVLGKYVIPSIPRDDLEKMERWAAKIVHYCRKFLDTEEGSKKMEKAIELLRGVQKKYKINLSDEELKSIAQYAYEEMENKLGASKTKKATK